MVLAVAPNDDGFGSRRVHRGPCSNDFSRSFSLHQQRDERLKSLPLLAQRPQDYQLRDSLYDPG